MSSGPSNVTTTQTAQPPSFLLPGFLAASQGALGQFPGGSQFGNVGSGILNRPLSKQELKQQKRLRKQSRKLGVPFLPNFNQGSGFNTNAVFPGVGSRVPGEPSSPAGGLLDQSADLTSRTLAGDFLLPDTNPFLESTFNRAADLTQNRLASEFAGAGRDLDASLPVRSEQLQTLAANIFGPNFQAERGRQERAQTSAQGLDPVNQLINRLAGLTPGAGGVTTSQQPVFNDMTGQILGGIGTGLALFSDRRLKTNIQRIGTVKGYPWYSFTYIWGESAEGVMADEVPDQFVGERLGFKTVDYAGLLS